MSDEYIHYRTTTLDGKQVLHGSPAVVKKNGYTAHYHMGLKHRVDGPAVVRADGSEIYYHMGKKHRLTGPAETHISRAYWSRNPTYYITHKWYINGKELPPRWWDTLGYDVTPETITEEEAMVLILTHSLM